MSITDRLRFTVIEVNTNKILSRDLVVVEPQVMKTLSGPSRVSFKIPQGEQAASSYGIKWKNWGQWIITEIEINGARRIFSASLVTDNKIDPESGNMVIEATGFSFYPKGIPWLENFNPIAVDPFEVVQRIWAHVQSYSNANLGVEVQPASSNTQMLPGYGFDGSILIFNFFAIFIRSVDFQDCADQITALSRDIPFDYFEDAVWNEDRTAVTKTLRLAYPFGGFKQEYLRFALGENVIQAEKAEEMDIEPVSDVIIRGWLPGKVYSSRLQNFDPTRLRRTIMEEDARIDSTERAAAWAKRKLQRRNVPVYWSKIIVDPNHPNAPYGSWDVGDTIFIQGEYPWVGRIAQWHRVMSVAYDESKNLMEVSTKVEGAFNYDPILFDPDYEEQPTVDPNLLQNGNFDRNVAGWRTLQGQWFRVSSVSYDDLGGSVRVDCDDNGERFISQRVNVVAGKTYSLKCVVKWEELVSTVGQKGLLLKGFSYLSGGQVGEFEVASIVNPSGSGGWHVLEGQWTCPANGVNELAIQFTVDPSVTGGKTWWTWAKILPPVEVTTP